VILYYAAGAVIVVWTVFQSAGVDHRVVAGGALVPLLDAFVGHQAFAHTLLAPTVALVVVMGATAGRGHRRARRRAIGVPIGWYLGIALSGAFASKDGFWWPAFGSDFGSRPVWPPLGVAIGLEALSVVGLVWAWSRFGLADPVRRAAFLRDGRLDPVR
jgi:hypothetical protein